MNLADVLKLKDAPIAGVVEDYSKGHAFFDSLDVVECSGVSFNAGWIKSADAPIFRAANTGIDIASGSADSRLISLEYVDFSVVEDVKIAEAHSNGPEEFMSLKQSQKIVGALQGLEKQMLLGKLFGDTAGFEGAADLAFAVNATSGTYYDVQANDFGMDCSGLSAAKQSMIYAINPAQFKLVLGKNGTLEMSDLEKVKISDANGKPYSIYSISAGAWIGCYIAGDNAFRVAYNVQDTINSDTLAALNDSFSAGLEPEYFVMNKKLAGLLRKSMRTDLNVNPDYINDIFGKKIITIKGLPSNLPVIS